jgi:hypothetical protein
MLYGSSQVPCQLGSVMDVLVFACAQTAVVDSRTNQLSLFNLLEEVHTSSFPYTISGLALVLVMLRTAEEPEEVFVTVQSTQGGRVLSGFSLALQFHHHLRTRVIADLNGLTAVGPGMIELSVLSPNQSIMASWKVRVNRSVDNNDQNASVSDTVHPEGPGSLLLEPTAQKTRDSPRGPKKH